MSATGRSDVRHPDDNYVTPGWCVDMLLAALPPIADDIRIAEPGCGSGAILDVLAARGSWDTVGIEMNMDRARESEAKGHRVLYGDFLHRYDICEVGAVIMNPPYSAARDFIGCSIRMCLNKVGDLHCGWKPNSFVAALLRLSFLESKKRRDWWIQNPADVHVLPRPSFCHSFKCVKKVDGVRCEGKTTASVDVASLVCPLVEEHGNMRLTKTDAAAYAWFVWGPGPRGRVTVL